MIINIKVMQASIFSSVSKWFGVIKCRDGRGKRGSCKWNTKCIKSKW
jgi:hypothetical protein